MNGHLIRYTQLTRTFKCVARRFPTFHATVPINDCSFCGKSYPAIAQLVVSSKAGICEQCTNLCQQIITEESAI